jgi:DNA-binding PadR family transcriptional regulator
MPRARTATSTRALTTTEAAVLALLAIEGERSGYDLLGLVRKAIGYVWAPARSQLYTLLPRLVKDGFAESRSVVQAARPDKTLYRITPAGREALAAWRETVEPENRDTFMLRLFVGGLTTDENLLEHVEAFRRHTQARLEELRAIEPTNTRNRHDFYHYLLLRLGIDQAELHLRWADWVLGELRREHE